MNKKAVYMASDHAGYKAKEVIQEYLKSKGEQVIDLGCFSEEPCDYPDMARELGEKVYESKDCCGIIICGTGIGVAMAANKMKGIRAAVATNEEMAEMTRRHNDANVLAMGSRITDTETMKKIADKFLDTDFESNEERHVRRVEKINALEALS